MNNISLTTLNKANEAAIYNIYLYLSQKTTPSVFDTFGSIILKLEKAFEKQKESIWNKREIYQLNILKNAIKYKPYLADSVISNLTRSQSGLNACSFVNRKNEIFVAYRGTASGEWIDNGEGLSGIPEENTYITYDIDGRATAYNIIKNDYATDQQVEALNWFNYIAAKNQWTNQTDLTVCGHSKGGNKAQFVAIHTGTVKRCFSFDGQGFSPEAIIDFKARFGNDFEKRRENIYSLSTENDYVNVLGERLMPEKNIHYFDSHLGLHYLEAIINNVGNLNPKSEQGKLSQYIESVSKELMGMPPLIRQYATIGIMNIFQKYIGKEEPISGDTVSVEKTIAGIGVAIGPLLNNIVNITKD